MAYATKTELRIPSGDTATSRAVDAREDAAFGLQMPSAFTGSSVSFQVSADNGVTFQPLYEYDTTTDDGSATRVVALAVVQGRSYDLPPALVAWSHFKIVSASAEAANRDLVVIGKRP